MIFQILLENITGTEEQFREQIYAKDGHIFKENYYKVIKLDTGSYSKRENRRQLLEFIGLLGIPKGERRRYLKMLGFWYSRLGTQK